MRWRIILIASLLLLACQSNTEPVQPRATETAPNTTNISQENQSVNGTDATANVTPKQRLQRFLQMRPAFKASYDVTTTYRGEQRSGTETVIVDGENSVRRYQDESFYILNESVYLCRDRCYNVPQDKPPEEIDTSLPPNSEVSIHSRRRIAGRDSTCFTIEYRGGEILDCRAEADGVLTRYEKSTSRYSYELRATDIGPVPDGAFDLPSTPVDISRMPNRTRAQARR